MIAQPFSVVSRCRRRLDFLSRQLEERRQCRAGLLFLSRAGAPDQARIARVIEHLDRSIAAKVSEQRRLLATLLVTGGEHELAA